MFWLELALKSLLNRRLTAGLTVLSIALSVALFLSVEKIRNDTKANFANTLTGTDLVIGARSGALNLLLYSVFRLGDASNNISWESYQELSSDPSVEWAVPISLGDSHEGFRVLGTTGEYFKRYQYGRDQSLGFQEGDPFNALFDVVIGSEVARKLGYELGSSLVLAHGTGAVSFSKHDDLPFTVSGILEPTGTPVDRSLHVSLEAIEAIHVGWESGVKLRGAKGYDESTDTGNQLQPVTITAAFVGMKSRLKTFKFQRKVNDYDEEPLMAIIPGATLQSLWRSLRVVENTLLAISALVVASGLLGMLAVILAGLNERRREMALLRALGAPAGRIFSLLCGEAAIVAAAGVAMGVVLHYVLVTAVAPTLLSKFGILLAFSLLPLYLWCWLLAFIGVATLIGALPAIRAYRQALHDGLSQRV